MKSSKITGLLARDEIESIEELEMSLMPPGLPYKLTRKELGDLIAFREQ